MEKFTIKLPQENTEANNNNGQDIAKQMTENITTISGKDIGDKTNKIATRVEGRASKIILKEGQEEDQIGSGRFGNVYKTNIAIINDGEKKRTVGKSFAVKEYKGTVGNPREKALTIYKELKQNNIPTWLTYRSLDDDRSILMTDGERDGSMIISITGESKSKNKLIENQLNKIENFDEVLLTGIKTAISAGNAGMQLHADAWFADFTPLVMPKKLFQIIRTRDNSAKLNSIFIGDYDKIISRSLIKKDETIPEDKIEQTQESDRAINLFSLMVFINNLLKQIVKKRSRKKYLKLASTMINKERYNVNQ